MSALLPLLMTVEQEAANGAAEQSKSKVLQPTGNDITELMS